MEQLLPISAHTNKIENHFDLLSCYLHSAYILYGIASDGMTNKGQNYSWNEHFITAFFLLRHAMELAIKALIYEVKGKDVNGHDIETLWKTNIPNSENILPNEIKLAFAVLDKYHILINEELFRYPITKKSISLKNLPIIRGEDFDALFQAVGAIRDEVLKCIHEKKWPSKINN